MIMNAISKTTGKKGEGMEEGRWRHIGTGNVGRKGKGMHLWKEREETKEWKKERKMNFLKKR